MKESSRILARSDSRATYAPLFYGLLKYVGLFLTAATSLVVFFLVGAVVFLAASVIVSGGAGDFFSFVWAPKEEAFGLLSMAIGSFLLAAIALAIGWPLAMGISLWMLSKNSGGRVAKFARFFIGSMTSVPTVVYGLAAVLLVTPLVREYFGGSGFSLLSAGIVLAALIVPTMALVMESGLRPRLDALCPEGLAVGFSRLELALFFIVPSAPRVIVTAGVIGFGRAIGDALIALMISGNMPRVPHGLSEGFRTIAAHIALVSANEVSGSAYSGLFLAGAFLLLVNGLISFSLRMVGRTDE